jgi:hypothetical protein
MFKQVSHGGMFQGITLAQGLRTEANKEGYNNNVNVR